MTNHRRNKLTVSLAVLLLAAVPALAGYTEGMECYKSQNWDCVIAEFNTEVEAHPEYDYGWFMIGAANLQKKSYGDAVTNLRKAIEINPEKLSYFLALSNAYFAQGQYDKVIATLADKDNLSGTAGETYNLNYQLGTSYHQEKDYGKAVPRLEKAVAVKPDFKTFYMLGVSYDGLNQPDKAIAAFKQALAQKPNDADVQALLASSFLGKAQRETNKTAKEQYYTEAVSYATKAAAASPNDYQVQNTLARAYLGADDYDKAEAGFKKVLSLKPNYCFAQINLGMVYIGKKDWNNAVKTLDSGTKCDPKNNVAWDSLGFAQEKIAKDLDTEDAKISQLSKALASFQKAKAIKSSSSLDESIGRVQKNIEVAEQNKRIAAGNLQKMENNLAQLKKGKADAEKTLADATKQRQFFLDKGSWTDEQEADYQKVKAAIEKDIANYAAQIAKQEKDIADAKANAPTT